MTGSEAGPPIDLNRDWPLLTDDDDNVYWRLAATRAATKVDAGICINPPCAGSLRGSGFTCGSDECVDWVMDTVDSAAFWNHLFMQVNRGTPPVQLGWAEAVAALVLVGVVSGAVVALALLAGMQASRLLG